MSIRGKDWLKDVPSPLPRDYTEIYYFHDRDEILFHEFNWGDRSMRFKVFRNDIKRITISSKILPKDHLAINDINFRILDYFKEERTYKHTTIIHYHYKLDMTTDDL